jgi:hypothetical protein
MPLMSRRTAALVLSCTALLLAACGGGSDSKKDPQLRVLNLSEVAGLDVYLDDERKVSAAGQGQLGGNQSVGADTYDVELRRSGSDLALVRQERSLQKDAHYTLVAWGRESALAFLTLPEDEDLDELDNNQTGLRVLNASNDVGDLDIYLTSTDTDLGDTVPTQGSVGNGRLTGYREMSSGTYRVRVTGSGDTTDLRLDIPALKLDSKSYLTLILTSGSGGVLVHGASLRQQGDFAAYRNTKARLRVAAGASNRGVVATSWRGRSVSGALASPTVSAYTLVDAGQAAMDVRINGQVVSNASRSLDAGADYSLLVYGNGSTSLLNDDNRLPTAGSSRARIRLVHGAPMTDPLTLSVDYAVTAADVSQGSASSFVSISSAEKRRVEVSAASAVDSLYVVEEARIQAGSLYTVFLLGGSSSAAGSIRKDR